MEGHRGASFYLFPSCALMEIARKLLKSMSIKQGVKYDSPESAKDIAGFIEFHNLNVDEILDPLNSFSSSRVFTFSLH